MDFKTQSLSVLLLGRQIMKLIKPNAIIAAITRFAAGGQATPMTIIGTTSIAIEVTSGVAWIIPNCMSEELLELPFSLDLQSCLGQKKPHDTAIYSH